MGAKESLQVLSVGLDAIPRKFIQNVHPALVWVEVVPDVEKLMDYSGPEPVVVFCGTTPDGVSAIELAQILRMKYKDTPIFYIMNTGTKVDRATAKKNGFTDVFFVPIDNAHILTILSEVLQNKSENSKVYRSIKVVDIKSDQDLDFDTYVYLPANNKHLKYSSRGQPMSDEKIKRLKSHKVASIFVAQDEMPKFYEYTAKVLRKLSADGNGMSETQRTEKLKGAVRDVVTGFFSDTATGTDGGRKIVEDCQNIVRNYISAGNQGPLYERVLSTLGLGGDSYSHLANVSTYASLFALGLGLKTVEETAMAGLLHDIGMSSVPAEIQSKSEEEMTPEERTIYEKHVEQSIALIQGRKLIVPEIVYKIIAQHHEKFNGTGYPNKISGSRFIQEAQVLAFADKFDELTAVTPGKPRKTPAEAIEVFRKMLGNPSDTTFDPVLLKKLIALFPPPADDSLQEVG